MLFAHDRELPPSQWTLDLFTPSQVCWAPCSTWKMHKSSCWPTLTVIALRVEFSSLAPPSKKKKESAMRGGCGNSVEGPPWGPFPPPPPYKKKRGRERSGEEATYGYYGFCLDSCLLMDFDAFSGCSWLYSRFVPLSLACNMSAAAELGQKRKKEMTICQGRYTS